MLRIVGYQEKIWYEKHKLLKHFQINAFWVISGDQLHCKQLLHSPKLTSTCIIPKWFFFFETWGINNLSWLKNVLFPKLLIVQERNGLAVAPLCLGLQTTCYWNKHWFLLSYGVLDCVSCSLLLKTFFSLFFFFRFTQMQCDGHLAECLSEMNEDIIW